MKPVNSKRFTTEYAEIAEWSNLHWLSVSHHYTDITRGVLGRCVAQIEPIDAVVVLGGQVANKYGKPRCPNEMTPSEFRPAMSRY